MTIFSRISKRQRSALTNSDQSDKSDFASPRSSLPYDSASVRFSTVSEPPVPAVDLRSRSTLGDREFTEQAVRFVLNGGGVRKFEKSGKSRPHGVEMRLIPCGASGPLLVWWDDAKQKRSPSEKNHGKLGVVVRVEDELSRQTARVDEFKGDAYFDKHLDEEVLFFTITLRSRSLFLLAASTLEKELWMTGTEAIQSGEAAQMPELLEEVRRATAPDAPAWLKKVVDSMLKGDEIAEPHATRPSARQHSDDSMRSAVEQGSSRYVEASWSKSSGEESSRSQRGSVEGSPRTHTDGGFTARHFTAVPAGREGAPAPAPAGADMHWSGRLRLPHLSSPANKKDVDKPHARFEDMNEAAAALMGTQTLAETSVAERSHPAVPRINLHQQGSGSSGGSSKHVLFSQKSKDFRVIDAEMREANRKLWTERAERGADELWKRSKQRAKQAAVVRALEKKKEREAKERFRREAASRAQRARRRSVAAADGGDEATAAAAAAAAQKAEEEAERAEEEARRAREEEEAADADVRAAEGLGEKNLSRADVMSLISMASELVESRISEMFVAPVQVGEGSPPPPPPPPPQESLSSGYMQSTPHSCARSAGSAVGSTDSISSSTAAESIAISSRTEDPSARYSRAPSGLPAMAGAASSSDISAGVSSGVQGGEGAAAATEEEEAAAAEPPAPASPSLLEKMSSIFGSSSARQGGAAEASAPPPSEPAAATSALHETVASLASEVAALREDLARQAALIQQLLARDAGEAPKAETAKPVAVKTVSFSAAVFGDDEDGTEGEGDGLAALATPAEAATTAASNGGALVSPVASSESIDATAADDASPEQRKSGLVAATDVQVRADSVDRRWSWNPFNVYRSAPLRRG